MARPGARVQVRRKGKYVNNTFLRRKDAPEWGLETEHRIDLGEPSIARREARAFGDVAPWAAEATPEVVRAWLPSPDDARQACSPTRTIGEGLPLATAAS